MKDNYDMSGAIKNPFAERRKKHGYTIQVGESTTYVSPEDIEEMNYPGSESVIPREIRKRIRQAVAQDVSLTRAGGDGVGAMIRLTGYDNDAEALYTSNPERYVRELDCIERQLQAECGEIITFTVTEFEEIAVTGVIPQRAIDFLESHGRAVI